ncbi:uncharacterized protein LOC131851958 [Achroia grisella]|uniref:uncharacterized protein LOC131851958 n=1 Tax=Achroia grisella TaxID=688607 RepID=UPI0027D33678|nr:uncharacterized protein LOC131851958 [Achroia grisella]
MPKALNDDIKIKNNIANEIIQKVHSFTLKSLPETSYDDKIKILKKLESKLQKTGDSLGTRGDKYIRLIMQGIKTIFLNNTKKENNSNISNWEVARKNNDQNTEINSKGKIIKDIVYRIESLARKTLENAISIDDKRKIIEEMSEKITDLAEKKHIMVHDKHGNIKTFNDLIIQGVKLMMEKTLANNSRRMHIDFVNSYNVDSKKSISSEIITKKNYLNDDSSTTTLNSGTNQYLNSNDLNNSLSCEQEVDKACSKVKTINQLKCAIEDNFITVDKLCNGVFDCGDRSDEYNCVAQAAEKVQSATIIILEIQSKVLRTCVNTEVDNVILRKQNDVLSDVLKSQLTFIQKYSSTKKLEEMQGNNVIKKTVNEVATVLSTLSSALEGSICPRNYSRRNAGTSERYTGLVSENVDEPDLGMPLKYCTCDKGFCANNTCTAICRRVCWEKYILGRFGCQAVDENSSVPLDFLCDGKLDCYDETDELGCIFGVTYAKFESVDIYNTILKIIATKAVSEKYAAVRNSLLSLHASTEKLQKLTVKLKPDILSIKAARESSFEILTSIYIDIVNKTAVHSQDIDEAHEFLMSLNEKLITALKRSNTGNERILATNGCFCKNGRCALPECSKKCSRACSAEPKLTRYYCKEESKNSFVPIDSICDGRNHCPNGDDETHCKKDVCRKHHLLLLQKSLEGVDAKHKGTALGEILNSWKIKGTATLKIAENNGRPTINILRDVVGDILRDLVATYASVDEFRRTNGDEKSNNNTYKDFFKISQQVIDVLKECAK